MNPTRDRGHERVFESSLPTFVGDRHRDLVVEKREIVPQQRADDERQRKLIVPLGDADQRHCRRRHHRVEVEHHHPADIAPGDVPTPEDEGPRLSQSCFHDHFSTNCNSSSSSSSSTSSSPVNLMKASSSVPAPARRMRYAAVPSATSLPCARKPMRTQSRSASAMSCVVSKIVVPSRD